MPSKTTGEALSRDAAALREVGAALQALERMNLSELRARHQELYGTLPPSKNLPYLRKRLAFRIQERVEGGLSPFALAQLESLRPAELPVRRKSAPRPTPSRPPAPTTRDARLPAPGSSLSREHQGLLHEVEVGAHTFSYNGREYRSLSAIAREITGTAWNGFLFFGLATRGGQDGR